MREAERRLLRRLCDDSGSEQKLVLSHEGDRRFLKLKKVKEENESFKCPRCGGQVAFWLRQFPPLREYRWEAERICQSCGWKQKITSENGD